MLLYRAEGFMHREACRVTLYVFVVSKETRMGYWVNNGDKWVSKKTKKRYAYPTEEEALDAFVHRKRRQVAILKEQLENAEKYLEKGRHIVAIKKRGK